MSDCKKLLNHISRLEGQLRRLRAEIETESGCEHVIPLALSAAKSFDSLRASMVEQFVRDQFAAKKTASPKLQRDFELMLRLIRAS